MTAKNVESKEREAYELRKKYANWDFINSQPPRIRDALKYYIRTGDIRETCMIFRLNIDEFRQIMRKANVPVVD